MDCKECLDENNKSILTIGYSYGYVGKQNNCVKHNKIKQQTDNYLLKWTDGKPYERTKRMKEQIKLENEEYSKNIENKAYTSSLHHDENTWEILNQSITGGQEFKLSNKREELGDKLANREMIQQIGYNPFLTQTSYVDDISISNQFLKPLNTTQTGNT